MILRFQPKLIALLTLQDQKEIFQVSIAMEATVFLIINTINMQQFEARGLEIKPYPLHLGKKIKNNMKRT